MTMIGVIGMPVNRVTIIFPTQRHIPLQELLIVVVKHRRLLQRLFTHSRIKLFLEGITCHKISSQTSRTTAKKISNLYQVRTHYIIIIGPYCYSQLHQYTIQS